MLSVSSEVRQVRIRSLFDPALQPPSTLLCSLLHTIAPSSVAMLHTVHHSHSSHRAHCASLPTTASQGTDPGSQGAQWGIPMVLVPGDSLPPAGSPLFTFPFSQAREGTESLPPQAGSQLYARRLPPKSWKDWNTVTGSLCRALDTLWSS